MHARSQGPHPRSLAGSPSPLACRVRTHACRPYAPSLAGSPPLARRVPAPARLRGPRARTHAGPTPACSQGPHHSLAGSPRTLARRPHTLACRVPAHARSLAGSPRMHARRPHARTLAGPRACPLACRVPAHTRSLAGSPRTHARSQAARTHARSLAGSLAGPTHARLQVPAHARPLAGSPRPPACGVPTHARSLAGSRARLLACRDGGLFFVVVQVLCNLGCYSTIIKDFKSQMCDT